MIVREAAPLRQQAVKAIREHITDGTYPPGSRLREKEISQTYDISRTVVREAMRQLESEQLIELAPNVGALVKVLTPKDVKDLYQAREAIESLAARLAANRASHSEVSALEILLERIQNADATNLDALVGAKDAFYDALIVASDNQVLGQMLANIQARISHLRRVTLSSQGRFEETKAEVALVLDAIKIGDGEAAHAAALSHVRKAAHIALKSVQRMTSYKE